MAKRRDQSQAARQIFALNMKALRLSKGLSQEKLAALASLHPNYVGSVERSERNISIDNIEKIAKALGISASTLFSAVREQGGT